MANTELLCDLAFVTADYEVTQATDLPSANRFRVRIHPSTNESHTFMISEKNGEQFASELDVLSAIIRAKVIRARISGEEAA